MTVGIIVHVFSNYFGYPALNGGYEEENAMAAGGRDWTILHAPSKMVWMVWDDVAGMDPLPPT